MKKSIAHPLLSVPTSPQHAAAMAAALIAHHRGRFGDARMEADGDAGDGGDGGDGGEQSSQQSGDQSVNEHGFPEKTPIKDMTPEQQVAYWKHKARKHEDAANARSDYDTVKAERDQLRQAGMSADEKALEDAKKAAAEEARAQERATWAGRTVRAELRAALGGKGLKTEQINAITAPIDPKNFLTDAGEVDADKVSEYASGFGGGQQWPDMGQGRRGGSAGKESGADLHKRYYGGNK